MTIFHGVCVASSASWGSFQQMFRHTYHNYEQIMQKYNRQLTHFLRESGRFQPALYHRSIFGMVHIYNNLPQALVQLESIKDFQSGLTFVARQKCLADESNWSSFLSIREYSIEYLNRDNCLLWRDLSHHVHNYIASLY